LAATTAGGMAGDRQEGAEENTVMHVFDGVLTWLRIGLAAVVVAALALLRRGTQALATKRETGFLCGHAAPVPRRETAPVRRLSLAKRRHGPVDRRRQTHRCKGDHDERIQPERDRQIRTAGESPCRHVDLPKPAAASRPAPLPRHTHPWPAAAAG